MPASLLDDAGLAPGPQGLELGGVPLEALAQAVGTPAYVYNAAVIRDRYRALDQALAPVPHRICYAVKANGNLAVLRLLHELGAGADIVSGGELARALAAGFPAGRVVFSGVGKRRDELEAAVAAGVGQVNVESLEELAALGAVAAEAGRRVGVGIRVNPDVTAETHPYISTGGGGIKFGVPVDRVEEAAAFIAAHPRLVLDALAVHLGSQLAEPGPIVEGARRLRALLEALRSAGHDTVRTLDLGGGLGIAYRGGEGMDPARYAEAVLPVVQDLGVEVAVEPGRFLVGPAGVLLTEVLYRKHSGGKDFVIVDAAMNDLLRPSLYQAWHEIVPVRPTPGAPAAVDVVGPVCETGDFLALDRTLPPVDAGALLAVLGAGAYGFAMSSNYNTRPRAAEVLVDDGTWRVVRRRETLDDLLALER